MVCRYRTGAGGGLANYYLDNTIPLELAKYYQRGSQILSEEDRRTHDLAQSVVNGEMTREAAEQVLARARSAAAAPLSDADGYRQAKLAESVSKRLAAAIEAIERGPRLPIEMHFSPRVADKLGLDLSRTVTAEELGNILGGHRADGNEVEGSARNKKIGFVDISFSAHKSFSVATLIPASAGEQAELLRIHEEANEAAMRYAMADIGYARKGAGGCEGAERGETGCFTVTHYNSRPTVDLALGDSSERKPLPVPGAPNLHSHNLAPNLVVTDGRAGSLDLDRMGGRIHEWGAIFHAEIAQRARARGVRTELDQDTGTCRLPGVPQDVCDAFSPRRAQAEEEARKWAAEHGHDWNAMSDRARSRFIDAQAKVLRQGKGDGVADAEHWRSTAAGLGWKPKSVIGKRPIAAPALTRERRHEFRRQAALPFLEEAFATEAVINFSQVRVAAARSLIVTGFEGDGRADVDSVVKLLVERGIRQDGQETKLVIGQAGQELRVTTDRHLELERRVIALAEVAARDRSGALAPKAIERAVKASGLDFSSEHGRKQREVIEHLGTGGRITAAIGVGGAGKTTLLMPLVDAWHRDGRAVWGTALAARQADQLAETGIANTRALEPLLADVEAGKIGFNRRTVVVLDELSQVSTKDMLRLLQIQARTGAQIAAVGDPRQNQSIEAGNVVELLRRSLSGKMPELSSSVRQARARDRETALMFRDGRAAEALARKVEDKTLELVPGGYGEAVAHAAGVWAERTRANAGKPKHRVTITAPSNDEARDVSRAIRELRRKAGEIGSDVRTLDAIDQLGATYTLPVAIGDRLRLFATTPAVSRNGKRSVIGRNASVVELVALDSGGMMLRNQRGNVGKVKWEHLTDRETGRILVNYGDCLTVFSSASMTSGEHINALPSGSQSVTAGGAYVAESRARWTTMTIISAGAEVNEITDRRPLGDQREITEQDVLANIARNFSRDPEKSSAVAFVDATRGTGAQGERQHRRSFRRREEQQQAGQTLTALRDRAAERRFERQREALRQVAERVQGVARRLVPSVQRAREEQMERVRETHGPSRSL